MSIHVAVVGSRKWRDNALMEARVRRWMESLHLKHPDAVIVSGGAPGVDITAEESALELGHSVLSFRPEKIGAGFRIVVVKREPGIPDVTEPTEPFEIHKSYGRAAYRRNRMIVTHSQHIAAFTNGSQGTSNTLDIAAELSVPVYKPDVSNLL